LAAAGAATPSARFFLLRGPVPPPLAMAISALYNMYRGLKQNKVIVSKIIAKLKGKDLKTLTVSANHIFGLKIGHFKNTSSTVPVSHKCKIRLSDPINVVKTMNPI
jgi:hypothetical protein